MLLRSNQFVSCFTILRSARTRARGGPDGSDHRHDQLLEFPVAEKLLPRAAVISPRTAASKARCRQSGVPVIYANENRGRWRSDFRVNVVAELGIPTAGVELRSAESLLANSQCAESPAE